MTEHAKRRNWVSKWLRREEFWYDIFKNVFTATILAVAALIIGRLSGAIDEPDEQLKGVLYLVCAMWTAIYYSLFYGDWNRDDIMKGKTVRFLFKWYIYPVSGVILFFMMQQFLFGIVY